MPLSLHPLRERNTAPGRKRQVLKIAEKIFRKDLVVSKRWLIFAPLSAEKSAVGTTGKAARTDPAKRKKLFFIAIYLNSVLWSIWAAKSFPLSRESEFQTIPLRLELKIYNKTFFYNGEFDPGSGWTLAAGLTHASRGASRGSNTLVATGARVRNAYVTYL